ncbi:MAG TPA: EFR1 family ferrodoxin [Bacillota bacterium]|nr:EFR1 family ferrodoxin [Bacillota bacterium]
MSAIIYYFSATGNSLSVAKKLQQRLPDCQLVPVASLSDQTTIQPEQENVGFVFPLYYLGLPMIIRNFVTKLQLKDSTYLFAVITRGNKLAGGALHQLDRLLRLNGQKLQAGFYITLPDNYTPVLNLPNIKEQETQFQKSETKVTQIAEQILARKSLIEGALFSCFHPVMNPGWVKRVKTTDRDFKATTSCNGCGVCVQICPVDNIQLNANQPLWQHHCEECLACLHACPQKAINKGGSSKKPQYRHPDVTLKEIMAQKNH